MSWPSQSNFDLNPAAQTKQQLQFSIPSSNLAFFQPNFVMAVAKCLQVPSFQATSQPMSFTTLLSQLVSLVLVNCPLGYFFKDILKPGEGISEAMEASRVFQLGSDLPSLYLHEWTRSSFTFHLYDLSSLLVLQCDIAKWALHARLKLIRVLALEGCTFEGG